MPACHNDQEPGVLVETIKEVVSEPRPCLIAVELGIRLSGTFNRIVDHTKVETKAVDRAVDCGVTKTPLVIGELNEVVIGSPASPADTQIRKDFAEGRVATKGAEQIAICGRTEFVRIGRKDRVEIGDASRQSRP